MIVTEDVDQVKQRGTHTTSFVENRAIEFMMCTGQFRKAARAPTKRLMHALT